MERENKQHLKVFKAQHDKQLIRTETADVFPLCPTSVIAQRLGNKLWGAAAGSMRRTGRQHGRGTGSPPGTSVCAMSPQSWGHGQAAKIPWLLQFSFST